MARYLLYSKDQNGPTPDELQLIQQQTRVIDTSRRVVLVEVDAPVAQTLALQLPGWTVEPEIMHPLPNLKRRIK